MEWSLHRDWVELRLRRAMGEIFVAEEEIFRTVNREISPIRSALCLKYAEEIRVKKYQCGPLMRKAMKRTWRWKEG